MIFKETNIPIPDDYDISQMRNDDGGDSYTIFVKKNSVGQTIYSCYYISTSNSIAFFATIENLNLIYIISEGYWKNWAGSSGERVDPPSFDEIGAEVFSPTYAKKLSQNGDFNFGCYLSSTNKLKLNIAETYSPLDFVVAQNLEDIVVDENGTYLPSSGHNGIREVVVDVYNKDPKYQDKTVIPSNQLQEITYDSDYNALKKVTVGAVPIDDIGTITENGTYKPSDGKFIDEVNVNVFQLDTSDATATSEEIFKDKTAYVDGEKVVGAFTIDEELTDQNELLNTIKEALKTKLSGFTPSGTIEITENGSFNVYDYEIANVNVTFNLQRKTVSPSTVAQTITADSNYDGLQEVVVEAAPLGIKAVSPSTTAQTITPDSGDYGLSEVNISAVTADIDENIVSTNIVKGVNILGVEGEYEPLLQDKTVTPTTSEQQVTADSNYYGLNGVFVEAIQTQEKTITENGEYLPDLGKFFSQIIVNVEGDEDMEKLTTQTVRIQDLAGGVYLWDYDGEKTLNYITGTYTIYENPTLIEVQENGAVRSFYLVDHSGAYDSGLWVAIFGSINTETSNAIVHKRDLIMIPTVGQYVTMSGPDIITGAKTFLGTAYFGNGVKLETISDFNSNYFLYHPKTTGTIATQDWVTTKINETLEAIENGSY